MPGSWQRCIQSSRPIERKCANVSTTPSEATDYPLFAVAHIQNPNRLWAFPIIGGTIKTLIILPVAVWLLIVEFAATILTIINSLVVLFTGKYWEPAYTVVLGSMRLSTKANCFILGLTDSCPGFSLDSGEGIELEIAMPAEPSRFFALPWIGLIVRLILLIPMLIFLYVIGMLTVLIFWIAWIPVLFAGQYPLTLFSIMVYGLRLQLRVSAYTFGLSDRYPKFG